MGSKQSEKVKCVIWDLDNTIWDGILLEDQEVFLKKGIISIISTLDERGILQSISSKNDFQSAMKQLKKFNIDHYFIFPQINWNSKVESIKRIKESINIGFDTLLFIDDQSFERDEVKYSLPEVKCLDAQLIEKLLDLEMMNPVFITDDSKFRRHMYQEAIKRDKVEEEFKGSKEEFLKTLKLHLVIFQAKEKDLQRAEELTIRTNQLNATGYTYSYDELNNFRKSKNHMLFMAKLSDIYGNYGHIGLILIEKQDSVWIIKLFLMSCRVMSRGIGSVLLAYIKQKSKKHKVKLQAEFRSNEKNRMMNITYRLSGFNEVFKDGNFYLLENDLSVISDIPDYIHVREA
jgi:FkbH-like protein